MKSLSVVDQGRFLGSLRWRQLFDMDEPIQVQIARLESDVHHIQTDVADIKVELRRTNDKIDGLREDLTQKIEGVRQDLTQKIEGVRQDLTQKIDGVREGLTQKIEGVRQDLTQKIDGVRQDIASAKVWAMCLYFALAGSLLFVMAKGFKWL